MNELERRREIKRLRKLLLEEHGLNLGDHVEINPEALSLDEIAETFGEGSLEFSERDAAISELALAITNPELIKIMARIQREQR